MADTENHQGSPVALPERRRYVRAQMFEYVELGNGENGGLILDLSEGGLSLQAANKIEEAQLSRLRFQIPASNQWIEAKGRLVRVSESGKEARVEFVDLPKKARMAIREWVSSGGLPASAERSEGTGEAAPDSTCEDLHISAAAPATSLAPENDRPATYRQPRPIAAQASMTGPAVDERPKVYPRPETGARYHSWWAFGGAVIWIAAAVVVALLALGYSPRHALFAGLNRLEQAWSGSPRTAEPFPANVAGNVGHPAAQKPAQPSAAVLPLLTQQFPSASATTAVGTSQVRAPSVPAPSAEEQPGMILGALVTQTLAPAAAEGASRERAERRPRASALQASDSAATSNGDDYAAILINAPPIGGRPFRLNLGEETVSASSSIAVTTQRSILVPPLPASVNNDEKVQVGKLLLHVDPIYPLEAIDRRIEGTVSLLALIGPYGEVVGVRLVSGPALLASAAISAVREWRYEPTLINGQAIETVDDVSVVFRLP